MYSLSTSCSTDNLRRGMPPSVPKMPLAAALCTLVATVTADPSTVAQVRKVPCADAPDSEWQPTYPRDQWDAWSLVNLANRGPDGGLMCLTAAATSIGVDVELVIAPCSPQIVMESSWWKAAAGEAGGPRYVHGTRGWENQTFYVTSCSSYQGTGGVVFAYGSVRVNPTGYNWVSSGLCIGELGEGGYGLHACAERTATNFTSTPRNVWGLRSPGACPGESRPISNASRPSVLKDDTVGGETCLGAANSSSSTPSEPAVGPPSIQLAANSASAAAAHGSVIAACLLAAALANHAMRI